MPRVYNTETEGVAVSAPQDLAQIKGAAGKTLKIKEISTMCTDTSPATNQMFQLRARFLPATVTDGSGGSTPTPVPMDPGDAAASYTAKFNNTVKATSSGTAVVVREDATFILQPYVYTFPVPPVVGPSESFVFELLSTVSGTVHLSTNVVVEETGG